MESSSSSPVLLRLSSSWSPSAAVVLDMTPLLLSSSSSSTGTIGHETTASRDSSAQSSASSPASALSSSATSSSSSSLRRCSSRGSMLRESSLLVRESAAEQLEQTDWAYSRPVVVLDLIWNFAFVVVALLVLLLGLIGDKQPCSALHLWVLGYALQCVLHMSCVASEYHNRRLRFSARATAAAAAVEDDDLEQHTSLAKRLESANTIFSFVWWIVGFYWITAGSETLPQSSPRVYWLCIVFLAFDVFFVVFCVALACVIGIAICCCLPCIIAILYAVADQEGASMEDINLLPKYSFRSNAGKQATSTGGLLMLSSESLFAHGQERNISADDAECCICLAAYDDGAELRQLPCTHHFHGSCIAKWLQINATCPLCKFNIIHRNRDAGDEV